MTDDDTTHDPEGPSRDDSRADPARESDPADGPAPDDAPVEAGGTHTPEGAAPSTEGRASDRGRRPPAPPERDRRVEADDDGRDVRTYVLWVALAVLGLFSVVLLFQFYGSTMQAITDWVGPEYRAVVRSAVSLVLLCVTLVGVVRVTRELTG